MTHRIVGPVSQSATRTEDGHRNYTITWHIQTTTPLDGPATIFSNWVLPNVGDTYADPTGNDVDVWAFCTPELNIAPVPDAGENEPFQDWHVTQHWTTKPTWRCQTLPIENPLLEPFQLSGDFTNEQFIPRLDKDDRPLLHPNFQPIQGQMIEQKKSWPTITITFNSATLPLSTYVLLINKVNDDVLWDLPARCVRFIDAKWERLLYGTCFYYFRTSYTFEFDIDTFDKPVPASGTKRLKKDANGVYIGDPTNPLDFEVITDLVDEQLGAGLDSIGREIEPGLGNEQYIQRPKIAKEGNLLLLGIPSTLL